MRLERFILPYYEEVVNMFYEFTKEIYPERRIGEKYFFYKEVLNWINDGKDIILAKKDDEIAGFSLAYIDENGGLTNTIYHGDIVYVKPQFRKTRAAYLLYKNGADYAEEKGLSVIANGLATTDVAKMIKKHFDCKEMFINFERTYHG